VRLEFADEASADIYAGKRTKAATRALPAELHGIARRKLDQMAAALSVDELKVPPGNRLEKKKGNLSRFYAIRINDQYRILFVEMPGAFTEISIVDYH
jgi:toxin HigB-1